MRPSLLVRLSAEPGALSVGVAICPFGVLLLLLLPLMGLIFTGGLPMSLPLFLRRRASCRRLRSCRDCSFTFALMAFVSAWSTVFFSSTVRTTSISDLNISLYQSRVASSCELDNSELDLSNMHICNVYQWQSIERTVTCPIL